MGKLSLGLFLVLVSGAVLSVSAYSDQEVKRFISTIPEEDRQTVLRYAIIRGYELTERRSSGMEIPEVHIHISVGMMKAIYGYYLRNHSISEQINYPYPLDIICFPSGCIEIDDPGIHP